MDTKHDIPHREIGEQDDELLEQLWKQLPDSQEDPFIADQGFKDLQGRIQRKLRIKRRFRILTAGSIAAALITGVLIFRTLIPSEQVSTAIAQLQDMGVTISDDQVILKMGNEVVMSLDSAARIELNTADDVALQTAAGKKLALASERILKLEVPAGRHFQMTLSDGTKVWLNAQSTLTYSHDFGRNERNVELDGGAYFEVAKNREIPFYVNTETNQVRIVETHFNVCAYRGSNEFTTTLLEGIVDIYAKGSEHSLTRLGGTRFLFSGTESSERSVLLILIISVGKMVYTVLMILLLTCCLVNWRNIIK